MSAASGGECTVSPPGGPPSGAQWRISHGTLSAVVVEVGGALRGMWDGEVPLLDPFPLDAVADGGHGAVLVPWPNRLRDGRYAWDGVDYTLALTEPKLGNAIHGLLRWWPWRLVSRAEATVTVGTTLWPMPGWPFPLEVLLAYALGDGGLTVTLAARNVGTRDAPFACGFHPYLSANGRVDELTVTFTAASRVLVDERSLPCGAEPVDPRWRVGRTIGAEPIDHAFTGWEGAVHVTRPDGRALELWAGPEFPWMQLYTGDTLAPVRRRIGLAVEPMSAPPNALATGEGVARLAPGERWTGRWGLRVTGA